MKTSIATVSIAGDFREKLSAIASAGFDGIEIFEQDFIGFEHGPLEAGNLVRDFGLEIMLFQPFRDFEGLPQGPLRERAFARARQKFEVMNRLGTDLMLICSSVHPGAVGGIDRCADDLAELGEIAATYGVRVGYEALAWGRHVNDHRDAWEIVRRADHANVGLILDSYHTMARGIDPDSIRSIPGDRIFFLQLADAPAIDMDLLYLSRHFRNMPGEGDLDLRRFMAAVAATGYGGPLSLEIFNDQFRRTNAHLITGDGHRALVNLHSQISEATGVPDVPLPAAAAISAMETLEFHVPSSQSGDFTSLLNAMGFDRDPGKGEAGGDRHQTLTQANLRIVVGDGNSDVAGPVLTRFGLVVDNAQQAVRRAVALGADPAPGNEGAIVGLHGSVISFDETRHCGDGSDIDSLPLLTRVDHLSQTLAYEEMLSWSLFYTTIFALSKSPIVDVVDPDGLVKSQILSNDNAAVRIILNGSDGPQTQSGSFPGARQGSAAHHVAFCTADIFALSDRLARCGFDTLAHSQNYYDDLEARFGLDQERMERLSRHNVMYDEDEEGAFYQLYLPSFENGFFFEFVQREAGYRGLGAANAPYRLAAQRRRAREREPSSWIDIG